jgi:hypothetical protein
LYLIRIKSALETIDLICSGRNASKVNELFKCNANVFEFGRKTAMVQLKNAYHISKHFYLVTPSRIELELPP